MKLLHLLALLSFGHVLYIAHEGKCKRNKCPRSHSVCRLLGAKMVAGCLLALTAEQASVTQVVKTLLQS